MVIASAVPGPDGTSATLTAVPVYDERGVEYAFTCTSGNGHDSGWQESNVYSDTGLTPGETYTYTVTARDRSPARNETSPSMPVQLTLPATVTMPSLAGLPESHAVQFLQSLNLTTSTVTLAHTGTLPDGFVFSHTPSTGLQAPIGSAVALVVEDNQIPVADSQSVTTAEDTAKAITLTGSDADGDALTYIILTPPAHGTLSGTAPNVTYTPAANYYGSDAFTFKVNAGALDSSPATVSLTVTSVNDLPTVALTAPASGSVYTPPAAMTLTATAADLDGTIAKVEFFNGASLIGTDTTSPYSFTWSDVAAGTYTLSAKATDNEGGLQASASVNVTVNEFDLPFFDGFELSNLRSLEGQNGWTANGAEVQTSDAFAGSNAVTIDSEDGFVKHTFAVGETSVWTDMRIKPVFSVRVMPAPANASAAFFFNMSGNPVVYDGATPVTLSGTAISAGQWVRVSIHSDYVAKTWDLYIDGVEVQAGIGFHAAAATGYRSVKVDNGSETFGTKLDNVSVGITVPNFSPNIVPTADAGTDQTVTDADGDGSESVTLDGSASTDSDGTITGYVWKEGATQIATGVSPTVSLAVGAHTITLTVTDNDGATDTATVNVTVNAAPTGGAYEQNAQGLISIEAEHYTAKMDAAEEAWTEITDSNASGGVAMDSTPDDGVSIAGEARMDYRVNFVKTGTHYIWVRGRAWPRTGGVGNADSLHMGVDGAIADTADKITGFNTSYAWSRSTMDGPVATITVTSTGVHDVNVFVREDGFVCDKIVLTTDSGYVPSATGPTESAFVSFNQAPVANAQSVTTAEDTAKAITLAGSDADGDALTYAIVSQPAHGTLSGTVPNVTYTPAVDYNGSDAFTFKVNDGTVDSAVATVSLTVTAVNDPLVVNAGTDQTVTLGTDVPWTPADLSPAAWYDAADAATITASSGAVSEWQDKSGNGNHATQATSTAQPTTGTRTLNGLNVIDFDGTDDQLLDATFASLSSLNLSIFAVQKHDRLDVQSMTAWGLGRNTSTEGLFFHSSYNTVFSLGCRYPENTNVYYTENTNVELLSYVKAGTSSQEGWVDGVSKGVNSGTVTTFTTERLALGSRFSANYLDGSIGEFIVIPGAVSEEDRQKLEGYLAHKWGLEANLPADHPYKTEAPSASQALATLSDASVTDADGDTPNSTWTVLSAPTGGTAVFDNANLVNPAVSFDTAGEYVLRLTADDGIETGFDEVTVTVNAPQTGEAYEQDAQGLVSIEAEHYTAKTDAADVAWTEITDSAASGGLAMDSAPDDGVAITSDVRMDYRVNFVKTGTHYIWVRGRAWPRTGSVGNADSLHMGLDGPIAGTADNISGFSTSYAWSGSTMDGPVATITVTSTGVHDINVFVREDGFVCDKIVLTTDSGYVPSGTGPAASVLVSLDPVPVAKALSVTTADDTTVTITPSATTDGTPIAWLESFDITSNYDVAAMEDPDGDGALTWEEYQAGTDPTNAASVFRLMTVTTGQGGDHKIVWYGTTNSGVTTEFVVYRCTNLFSDVWVPVSTNARSATGTNTWIGSGASGAAYYRVGF